MTGGCIDTTTLPPGTGACLMFFVLFALRNGKRNNVVNLDSRTPALVDSEAHSHGLQLCGHQPPTRAKPAVDRYIPRRLNTPLYVMIDDSLIALGWATQASTRAGGGCSCKALRGRLSALKREKAKGRII